MTDKKTCILCSCPVTVENIETFPLGYENNCFIPMSNLVFCTKPCVKRYLLSNETFLQTLYSLYCLVVYKLVGLKPAPDPLFLACRQIKPHPTLSITFSQFHETNHLLMLDETKEKQCALCFKWFDYSPVSYVLGKEHNIYCFANIAFCAYSCVKRHIKKLEPYYTDLLQEAYSYQTKKYETIGVSPEPKKLLTHQRVAQPNGMTSFEFDQSFEIPRTGLSDPRVNAQYSIKHIV